MGTSNLIVNTNAMVQPWSRQARSWKKPRTVIKKREKSTLNISTVEKIISSIQPLPAHSMLLGMCQDGLPFFMEMNNPEIGAILVGCDKGLGKTHQLQVMVDSAMKTHTPHELQVLILSLNPTEWSRYQDHPQYGKYLIGIHAWYDPQVESHIQMLTDLAETRRDKGLGEPSVLIIFDDLNYVEDLSLEAQVNLRWLLAYGPQSNIWPISSIDAHLSQSYQYWLEPCRTRIMGRVESRLHAKNLNMGSDISTTRLMPGEFMIWTGTSWVNYHLPLLGG